MARKILIDNPVIIQSLYEAIEKGATIKIACQAAGIHENTFHQWKKRAKASTKENKYTRFVARMEEAEAKSALTHLEVIRNAAFTGDWRASKWILERRFPNDYGYSQTIKHSGDKNAPIAATFTQAVDYRDNISVEGDEDDLTDS